MPSRTRRRARRAAAQEHARHSSEGRAVATKPPAHRHFRTHEFHYTSLHPGEAELIDADLIRATCLVGTAEELTERIRDLEHEGLQELMFATGVDEKWRFAEDFSRRVMARV